MYRKDERELKAERKALWKVAKDIDKRYERGEITLGQKEKEERALDPLIAKHAENTVDFHARKAAYTEVYHEMLAEQAAAARSAPPAPQPSATDPRVYVLGSTPSSGFAPPSPIGIRSGSSTTSSTSSSSASSARHRPATEYRVGTTLGGATRITGNDGSTYTRGQTPGGDTQWKDNQGRTYTRQQTLGGGYRYSVR